MNLKLKSTVYENGKIILTFDNEAVCILDSEEFRMFSLVYKDMCLDQAKKCMKGNWNPMQGLDNK